MERTEMMGRGMAALLLMAATASAQVPGQPTRPSPGGPGQQQDQVAAQQARELGRQLEKMPTPLDSPDDFRDAARLVFMIADADRNGLISQQEAIDGANIAVGGLFFAADADGDGTVTQQEAQTVRERILAQQPLLRVLVQNAKQRDQAGSQEDPLRAIGLLLDSNNDKNLAATEVRGAVDAAVRGLYIAADTNRDGQMSPDEVNAAAIGLVQAAGEAIFQAADKDRDDAVSQAEFQQAIVEPANVIFAAIDVDGDGRISAEEAKQARSVILGQLIPRVPVARGAAPIPNIDPKQVVPARSPSANAPAPGASPAGSPAPPVSGTPR